MPSGKGQTANVEYNVGFKLGQRRRQWPNMKPALVLRLAFVRLHVESISGHCWPTVCDAGQALDQRPVRHISAYGNPHD